MDQVPDACLLPVAHPTPARHPRPTPEFLREHLPGDAAAEDKQNAGETRAIRDARPSAFRPTWWSWKERFDKIPQRIWKQRGRHTRSRYLANEGQVSEVLLRGTCALPKLPLYVETFFPNVQPERAAAEHRHVFDPAFHAHVLALGRHARAL